MKRVTELLYLFRKEIRSPCDCKLFDRHISLINKEIVIFTREPRSASESASDFVVLVMESAQNGPQLAGNGVHLQPCSV